jgi:hypothetical protein
VARRRVWTSRQVGQLFRATDTLVAETEGSAVDVTEPADSGEATDLALVAVFVAAEAPPDANAKTLARLSERTEPRKANVVLFMSERCSGALWRPFELPVSRTARSHGKRRNGHQPSRFVTISASELT